MKKIFVLIAVIAIIAGGFKGFVYYKVISQLNHMIAVVSPFVMISYKGVSSSFQGQVSVEGIRVKAYGNGMELAIDEASVKFADLKTLLFIGDDLKKQRLPQQMKLSLHHVRMDLQHMRPYMMLLESQREEPFQDYTLLGCGDFEKLNPLNVLQQLGYSELDSSMELSYHWDRASRRFTIDSDFRWHEMTNGSVTIEVDQVAALSVAALMAQPELKQISIHVEDEGYNTRLLNHCAAERNMSKDNFIILHVALMRRALAKQGVSFSEGVFDAYRYYLKSKGELVLQMRPGNIQQLANLHLFKPRDIPALLGLEVHLGDKVIRDIEFDWDERKFKQAMAALVEKPKTKAVLTEPKLRRTEPMEQEASGPRFQEIEPSALATQVNQTVRIITTDKREFKGVLRKVTDDRIFIDVPMDGGNATFPVRIENISLVKVKLKSVP